MEEKKVDIRKSRQNAPALFHMDRNTKKHGSVLLSIYDNEKMDA